MEARRFEPEVRTDWRSVNLEMVSTKAPRNQNWELIEANYFLRYNV